MHLLRSFLFLFFYLSFLALSHQMAAADVHLSSSSFSAALETLQKQIGYNFQTVELLRRAMTHSSYSRENCRALSILGLSAVEASAALRLLRKDADASADAVSRRIAEVSGVDACATAGARLGLEKIVRVSTGTDSSSPAVICAAFRAIFGAVAVDSGNVDSAGDVFWKVHGGSSAAAAM
ncbi:protein NUCLEAR FUSION DEFECTIVE 2 isoform X2 [Elaeis guineensis]|uniref:Protein NUCLEAR FUSION DEFECTIVE 2 n=1 Tax=Elaeis guineensis var. tenera TaxID=51953 RepID=A0A6I9QEJ6_ELAGV|nr:protein NUCLEAR FUSION DEFECTIVE 2 [Elaeis guineensis]